MDIKYIKTSDINMASTLYSLGYPIDGIYYSGVGDKMDFYFKDTPEVQKAMNDFWSRKLKVEPNELLWARKEIITRMKNAESPKKST